MADRKQQPMQFEGSKIDALYSWLSYDLQKMKEDLMKELKYASIQTGAFYNELNKDKNSAAQAMTQEIRFSYKQNQNIYDGLTKMIDGKFAAMEEMLQKALPADNFDYTRIAEETGDKILELISDAKDNQSNVVDSITNSVTEKVVESLPYPEKVDYARVAEIAEAAAASAVEKALNALADKMVTPEVDYEKLASMIAEKMSAKAETTYDLVVDQDGIDAIAKGVAEQITCVCKPCEEVVAEEPVVEEVVEEPVAEEVVSAADETVEESATSEMDEIAAALALQEVDNQLVDAETGLVIRLKRSFTAKMRQSEERIKGYYSDIKNELTSFKKINSNVSWHGDRFNFGRDTIAKINILGKTLCFYLALDPNDPEYKTTVYHQKDVSGQKAYASTPFMVKVKSDVAAKKALRLVGILAEKVGAEKDQKFEAVDYVEQFAYESTKELFEAGYIKATKEKKVDLDF